MIKDAFCYVGEKSYDVLCAVWTKIYKACDESIPALIVSIICVVIIVWIIASTIDVDMHNMPWQEHTYASWNFWSLFEKFYKATH